jgi:hypothetical protein
LPSRSTRDNDRHLADRATASLELLALVLVVLLAADVRLVNFHDLAFTA